MRSKRYPLGFQMHVKNILGVLLMTQLGACGSERDGSAAASARPAALLATSKRNAPLSPWRVLHTTRRSTRKLVTITTVGGEVVTTPDHWFARADGTWVPAARLNVGDTLVSAASPTGVPISRVITTDVPPTDVYNLTVDKTHTYAVGPQCLLVHNVNCLPSRNATEAGSSNPDRVTLADQLAREREQEREQQREREQRHSEIRANLQQFREEQKRRLEEIKRTFNDSHGDTNCVYCTLGGLSDYDKLSVFLKDHGLNEKVATSPKKNYELLERLKLRTAQTPPSATFKKKSKSRFSFENPQRDANKYMQESSSNTFALIIKGNPASPFAHSLIAVRRQDGAIVYVDLQKVPPETYERLNPSIGYVEVIPTDVDWRYNRQINQVVQTSPPTNPKRGWPM